MVLAKEHEAVTGPRSGFSVPVLTHTTVGCLGLVHYHMPRLNLQVPLLFKPVHVPWLSPKQEASLGWLY